MTVTAIALKVCAAAVKPFPQFNATIDMEKRRNHLQAIHQHRGGVRIADQGLLVPVIRDVDKKNIVELAVELSQLSQKARESRKSLLADMEGGTFTITNPGGIGGTGVYSGDREPSSRRLGNSCRRGRAWSRSGLAGKLSRG